MAIRSSNGPEPSYGSIIFRQDQLHIDLFVFFSVFFSCFFLFLAVCVVVWKVKQTADVRRARRQHVVEMLHLAKRPFARVYLTTTGHSMDLESPQPAPSARSNRGVIGGGARSRYGIHTSSNIGTQFHQLPEVMLIAIEPTFDNLAAVGTVFVSLPGRHKAPLTLALGSALVSYPRQFPFNARNFMRAPRGHLMPPPPSGAGAGSSAVGVGGGIGMMPIGIPHGALGGGINQYPG